MRFLFLLLIITSAVFAGCGGSISQYVPAVIGTNGGVINVTVSLIPGEGDVYITSYPRVGVSTQESVEKAVSYAYFVSSADEKCDVLFKFGREQSAGYVDGPSAGAAFTAMSYALFENETMRNDTIITGSVDEYGQIGPVGGLYEKARGAISKNARYFITPVESLYEMLLLKNLEEDYGIEIIEAENVEQIISFMIDNESIEQEPLTARKREIPELEELDYGDLEEFAQVSRRMIHLEEELVASIIIEGNETQEVKEFYENEVQRQSSIHDNGYLFSAANEAFLNYIDILTIKVVLSGDPDLPRKKGEVGICLTNIERPKLTDQNFEWIIGADQRQAWAFEKLDNSMVEEKLLEEEKFMEYHELAYGDAWCQVATSLVSAAPDGGSEVNEELWEEIAKEKIEEANQLGVLAYETEERLGIAEKSYEEGKYGAAIYDTVYVIQMEIATRELSAEIDLETEVPLMLEQERTSLWGNVYQSHAGFLYSLNQSEVAYRTIRFAQGLDDATAQMMDAQNSVEESQDKWDIDTILIAVLIICIFLFIIVIVLMGGAHGN